MNQEEIEYLRWRLEVERRRLANLKAYRDQHRVRLARALSNQELANDLVEWLEKGVPQSG